MRIKNEHTLHDSEKPELCAHDANCIWRVVECGGAAGDDRDIVECARCGKQRNVARNFDEDFA